MSSTPAAPVPPRLEVKGLRKAFPGVLALSRGELTLFAGEVHALMGENGAGKSTLIKILGGALEADAGTLLLDGREIRPRRPLEAHRLGIAVIHQELHLVPALSIRENLFLGQEVHRAGWVRSRTERERTRELLSQLGLDADPETPCRDLSVAEQQLVEIAKALLHDARVLVMDEPTAALSGREVERLFALVRRLAGQGIAVLYVSHRLEEVYVLCERITVMRDGAHVLTCATADLGRAQLIKAMVGRPLSSEFPPRRHTAGGDRLRVCGLRRGRAVRGVSFTARGGEILGLAGLVGAGRTETARLLFGADRAEAGTVTLDDRPLRLRSPRDAIRQGLCLLTEDRKQQGLVLGLSVLENFGLPNLARFSRGGWLNQAREQEAFEGFVRSLNIRIPHPHQLARHLSGGNQQKVVLAKWLQAHSEVIVFDEPTRGVDVGAKYEIYQLMLDLAAAGKVVIMISSDLPEILGLSDRILVLRDGQIAGEIREVGRATQADVLRLATHAGESSAPVPP